MQESLARLAYVKSLYPRSIVYNYSVNKVFREGRTGFCKNTIRKYFAEFIKNDFAYINDKGHLIFRPKLELARKQNQMLAGKIKNNPELLKQHRKTKKPTFFKMERGSIKDLLLQLNCEYVLTKHKQVTYSKKAKQLTVSSPQMGDPAEMPITIASSQLANYLGKSNSSAQRILRKANFRILVGFAHAKRKLCRITSESHFEWLKSTESGIFAYRGWVWQKKPTEYLPYTNYIQKYSICK